MMIRYCAGDAAGEVILDKLLFPNGVTLSHDGQALLIASTIRGQILEYGLAGTRAGQLAVFASELPGTPDNIEKLKNGNYAIGMTGKLAQPFALAHFLAPFPTFRRWLLGFPVPYEFVYRLIPRYGLVVILDQKGKIVRTLQDPTGRTPYISSVFVHGDDVWIGSWYNKFVGHVKTDAVQII
eukprot:c17492_g1_i2.p2 GENE.c17492_g1_i2~~c17492_g1_i2.p2  ORF type:complete len:182 (+),score=35.38 c17492_g1_i2:781-1326(+)